MNKKGYPIFKAIREGKALEVVYKTESGDKYKQFYCGIDALELKKDDNDINEPGNAEWLLTVKGMQKGSWSTKQLTIYLKNIRRIRICDNILYEADSELINDIDMHPNKYESLFGDVSSLNVLSYLEECYKYNQPPYLNKNEFKTIEGIDHQVVAALRGQAKKNTEAGSATKSEVDSATKPEADSEYTILKLSDKLNETIKKIIGLEHNIEDTEKRGSAELGMNAFSIVKGNETYPLAYWKLNYDLKTNSVKVSNHITLCSQLRVKGEDGEDKVEKNTFIHKFLREDEYKMFDSFDENIKVIGDAISNKLKDGDGVLSEEPFVFVLERELSVDLMSQFAAIQNYYDDGNLNEVLKIFLGKEKSKIETNRNKYIPAFASKMVDIDQIVAIDNAMTMPVSRIQGPPGTGKTNTIISTIISAFYNNRTVLFSSMNNKPVRDVYEELTSMKYEGTDIPFPVLRIGNSREMLAGIEDIRNIINYIGNLSIDNKSISELKKTYESGERIKTINKKLKNEAERNRIKERIEYLEGLCKASEEDSAKYEKQIKKLEAELLKINGITQEDLEDFLDYDDEDMMQYLYLSSVRMLKKLEKNKEVLNLFSDPDIKVCVKKLKDYINNPEGLKKIQEIFPVIIATNISAGKIGNPEPSFDLCIIDEAGQCDICAALIPIVRSRNLMLVGDPYQLKPVILLSSSNNKTLKKRYQIGDEYDFVNNSIYTSYSMLDTCGNEILLHNHYRCNKKIVEFSNMKYYGGKLEIFTPEEDPDIPALEYIDVSNNSEDGKNISLKESSAVIDRFLSIDRVKYSVGIITPFRANAEIIIRGLIEKGISDAHQICGTVHSFQGDQKDIILLSSAISASTQKGTYSWLSNNSELINVASTRAKKSLVVFSNDKKMEELHEGFESDDWYDFMQYVKSNGQIKEISRFNDRWLQNIKDKNSDAEDVLTNTIRRITQKVNKNKRKAILKESVYSSTIFNRDNSKDVESTWGPIIRTVVYDGDKPEIVVSLENTGDQNSDSAKKKLEERQVYCRKYGIELLQIPYSYVRRYNMIYENIESMLK